MSKRIKHESRRVANMFLPRGIVPPLVAGVVGCRGTQRLVKINILTNRERDHGNRNMLTIFGPLCLA